MLAVQWLKIVIISVFFSMLLSGCKAETEPKLPSIPTLNNSNIKPFIQSLTQDYLEFANALESNGIKFQQQHDYKGFIEYRNSVWTPGYILKKQFYEASFEKNAPYLKKAKLEKPFETFSLLIYSGLEMKHAIEKDDTDKAQQVVKNIDKSRQYMAYFQKS